jgi:hypothetical protein
MPPALHLGDHATVSPRVADCDLTPGALAELGDIVPVNVRTVCGMIGVKFELP